MKRASNIYLVCIFAIISVFFLTATELVQSAFGRASQLSAFFADKAYAYQIIETDDLSKNSLEQAISSTGIRSVMKVFPYSGVKAVWYNTIVTTPDLSNGRFFTVDDMKEKLRVAVVGRSIAESCSQHDGKIWYSYENAEFEVIGVLSDSRLYPGQFDDFVLINLGALLAPDAHLGMTGEYIVDYAGVSSLQNHFPQLVMALAPDTLIRQVSSSMYTPSVFSTIVNSSTLPVLLIVLIAVLSLNIVSISSYWISKRRKTISIMRALGASSMMIAGNVIKEFTVCTFFGFILGTTNYLWIREIPAYQLIGSTTKISFPYALSACSLSMLTGLLTSLIPMRHMINMQPALNIKE